MPSEREIVLHHVIIKGLADLDAIARATDLGTATVASEVDVLLADGLLVERTGRLAGFAPTAEGHEAHAQMLQRSDLRKRREELNEWYERFEDLNVEFKRICTAWQLKDADVHLVNDHRDSQYDQEVLRRLGEVHRRLTELIDAADHPRLRRYLSRLGDAFAAVQGGDIHRLTTPFCDSYHDIWMELHHDLLRSFDRERRPADS